jgi:predicted Zn-dependent protease
MKVAQGRFDRLSALNRLASAWNWPVENEEVLWTTISKFPAEKRAVQALSNLLYVGGKTRSLLTLYAQEAKSDPNNLAVKNNLASIALLLNAPEHKPHELAREVHEKQPDNPFYTSTYAFSLHLENKTADALKVMGQLKPEQLEQPQIAGYYGLMLAASGDNAKAAKYLDLAAKVRLLPEEVELLRRARM